MAGSGALRKIDPGADPDGHPSKSSYSQAGSSTAATSIEAIQDAVYEHCAAQPTDAEIHQEDMLHLIPHRNAVTLQTVTNNLQNSGKLKLMQVNGKACWRYVSAASVTALAGLDSDTRLLYSHIESAGRDGIWSHSLSKKTNLHKVLLDKAIKTLRDQKHLIKNVTNRHYPNRKMYMLAHLQPLEDVTGGPFFTNGELDLEFVQQISNYIERYVVGRSWWVPKNAIDANPGKKRKRKSECPQSKEDAEAHRAMILEAPIDPNGQIRPFPAGYSRYPTVSEMTNAVNDSKIANEKLRVADTQMLVDILVWDSKFERLKRRGSKDASNDMYRAIHTCFTEEDGVTDDNAMKISPLTEAPCGRCPVFDFCEDGGLVSAKTCPYFQQWLDF